MFKNFRTAALVSTIVVGAAATVLVVAPDHGAQDTDQRDGLVATAVMFEDTHTHYASGEDMVQAVYASQGITVEDVREDSYVSTLGPTAGDIVVGAGYVGILVEDGLAIGITDQGGEAQEMRVTNEEIRRVDW